MATVNFTGFELGDLAEFNTNVSGNGTESIQSLTVNTGTYALKVNNTGGATVTAFVGIGSRNSVGNYVTNQDVGSDAYVELRFQYTTKPGSGSEPIYQALDTAAGLKGELRITSGGLLAFYDSTVALVATGTTVLNSGGWYRVSIHTGTGASANYEVRVNGTTEPNLSGTANQGNTNHGQIRLGKAANRSSQVITYFFDDVDWDNAGFQGAVVVKALVPTADGTYTQWNLHGGASTWQCLGAIPQSASTNFVEQNTTGGQAATATLTTGTAAGITGTVVSVMNLAAVSPCGSCFDANVQLRFRSGSTNSDSTASAANHIPSGLGLDPIVAVIHDTDPATSSAWILSALNTLEAGVLSVAESANRVCDSRTAAAMVLFLPPPPPPPGALLDWLPDPTSQMVPIAHWKTEIVAY